MDVLNRNEKEALIARGLGREFGRFRGVVVSMIAKMAAAMGLPAEVWQEHKDKLTSILGPAVLAVALEQAGAVMDEFDFLGVDWGIINENAARWADRYAGEMVKDITINTERNIQQSISAYFEQQMTQGQLVERLVGPNGGGALGPKRAEMIAVTETTRAASEGEQQVEKELAAQGISLQPIWQTNNDEIVCTICGPRHNQPITDGNYPPAHPRCRCWVTHEVKE
jgi:hypothetical protein